MIIVVVKSPESNGVIISARGKTIDWKMGGNTASWIYLQNILTTVMMTKNDFNNYASSLNNFGMQSDSNIIMYKNIIPHHYDLYTQNIKYLTHI